MNRLKFDFGQVIKPNLVSGHKNLIKFLQGGDKAKITMRFRGREAAHQIIGREFLERVEKDLFDYGAIEQKPAFEGRQIVMVIAPKK